MIFDCLYSMIINKGLHVDMVYLITLPNTTHNPKDGLLTPSNYQSFTDTQKLCIIRIELRQLHYTHTQQNTSYTLL